MISLRVARLLAGVCAAAAASLSSNAARAEEGWAFGTGFNYSNGDYGEAIDTTIYAVPFSAGYSSEHWGFAVSIPYVRLDGSGNIVPGAVTGFGLGGGSLSAGLGGANASVSPGGVSAGVGGIGVTLGTGLLGTLTGTPGAAAPPPPPGSPPPPPPVRVEEEGFGDASLSFSLTPYTSDSGARLIIGADVRLPTGDDTKSLGAGETIGALSAGYALPIGGNSALFGAVGYQHAFDSDVSGGFVALAAETELSSGWLIGLSADYSEAEIDGVPNTSSAGFYTGVDVTEHMRFAAFAQAGLSEGSPDTNLGVRLVVRP